MSDKYFFKVYNIGDGDRMYPLYMDADDDYYSTGAHKLGNVYIDEKERPAEKYDDFNVWKAGKMYHNNTGHRGYSMWGLKDPRYSIFNTNEEYNIDLSPEEWKAVESEFVANIDPAFKNKQDLKRYYAFDEDNDYDYLTNNIYSIDERMHGLNKKYANGYILSPEHYNFNDDSNYDDLISIVNAFTKVASEGKLKAKPILIAAPESKLINVNDVVNNKFTAQRDSPHEIVATQINPVRKYEQEEFGKLRDKYFELRKQNATGPEAFYETFRLDPIRLSDANMKEVFMDLSKEYNKKRPVNVGRFADVVSSIGGY